MQHTHSLPPPPQSLPPSAGARRSCERPLIGKQQPQGARAPLSAAVAAGGGGAVLPREHRARNPRRTAAARGANTTAARGAGSARAPSTPLPRARFAVPPAWRRCCSRSCVSIKGGRGGSRQEGRAGGREGGRVPRSHSSRRSAVPRRRRHAGAAPPAAAPLCRQPARRSQDGGRR